MEFDTEAVTLHETTTKMTDNKTLALSLLHADTEDQIVELLTQAGYWNDPHAWRLLGDKDGNFSTVGNQQARPEAALVEKLVNSVDARLLNECLVRAIDPESQDAPRTISHAISQFFDGRAASRGSEGTIADWSGTKQLEQARFINLAVTGNKPRVGMPCITVSDAGEGQSPAKFPDTFLSIDKSNKLRIPFVQGKFNMGGTGVLKFCGKHSFQLIISRRNPSIYSAWHSKDARFDSTEPRDNEWGFTIVRRERPTGEAGDVRNSIFRYLAPFMSNNNNQVLSFASDNLCIFPDENRAYDRAAQFGTVIKLYEYDVKGFSSHALMKDGLLSRLEALLPQIALPVRVHECRTYKGEQARSFATSLVGLAVRLSENRGDNLEDGYPTTASFVVKGERMTAQIFAFKGNRAESYRTNEGILFIINGQTHGAIPKTFFERSRVKMGRLAKALIVLVDCSQMSVGAREDLFMNSRDRLSNGELRKVIEEELEEIIGKNPGLKALRERRRSDEIAERLSNSKPFEEILNSLLKRSPTLSRLFRFGQRLNQPYRADLSGRPGGGKGKDGGESDFAGRPHPTYFRFQNNRNDEELHRNAEIDRRCRIRFDTDAQNDYFERDHVPGTYEVEIIDGALDGLSLDHNLTLHDGVANWSIKLPVDKIEVGDVLRIQCQVFDATLPTPFVNVAVITVGAKTVHEKGDRKYTRRSNSSGGESDDTGTGASGISGSSKLPGDSLSGGIDPPQTVEVHRDDVIWKEHNFSDYTACKVIEDDSSYTFYINVDNVFLRTEMNAGREDSVLQQQKFLWGNVLIGLALIHDRIRSVASSSSESDQGYETVFALIESTTRAIAPFLIPMIDHLGALTEEEATAAATRGDDE